MPRQLIAEAWAIFRRTNPACCEKHDEIEKDFFYAGAIGLFRAFLDAAEDRSVTSQELSDDIFNEIREAVLKSAKPERGIH